ncbi:MAG: transketolase C-terminal domain-containing protein, partial [Desulfovibrionaceae bacterium]
EQGARAEQDWNTLFAAYTEAYPHESAEFTRRMRGDLPDNWQDGVQAIIAKADSLKENSATRVASQKVLEDLALLLPELVGGSADLTGSVGTFTKVSQTLVKGQMENNYISYGVREFAMGAMMNGMALHGGLIPYAGTFMIFSDYAKNAIRLSALMHLRVVWVLTHDSIGVGEDGPTHQPVEQVAGLRLIPHVHVWRPCDSVESAVAWKSAMTYAGPSCMSLSRQSLPFVERSAAQVALAERGGYILRDCAGQPEAIILATGSEISLALGAAQALSARGLRIRVVSMPCTAVFDAQDAAYKEAVLPTAVRARVAVEAASSDYWYKYTGLDGAIVGMTSFGASAPGKVLAQHFGFTVDNVVKHVEKVLQ